MPLRTLVYFYRRRLRVHAMQELLAGFGIAAGVALVFSVQVIAHSLTSSGEAIVHGIAGKATVQLAARDAEGFDAHALGRVREVDGVASASPVLEQRATVSYGGRRAEIDFVGVDPGLPSLGGLAPQRGILLPSAIGDALRLPPVVVAGRPVVVTVGVRGSEHRVPVAAVVGSSTIGSLAGGLVGVVSLRYAQELTGLDHRVSRVLVVPRHGREHAVRIGLAKIAAGRLTVAPVEQEDRLLAQATGPLVQSTGLLAFAGLLVAFAATLLTVPERRRFVATLRVMGCRTSGVVQILGFQALVLGIAASLAGLSVGWALSRTATQNPPGYLAFAFPLGIQRVVTVQSAVWPFLGGVLATFLAVAQPLLDLRRSRALNAVLKEHGEPGNEIDACARRRLALVAFSLTALATAALVRVPELTIGAIAVVAVAAVLTIPVTFAMLLRLVEFPTRRWHLSALVFSIRSIRATSRRSLALAATGAVAIFGSVAIEGAHRNLLHGLYGAYRGYVGTADIWIAQPDDDLALQPFAGRDLTKQIAALRGVSSARSYQGGLLDVAGRRIWVIARPPTDRTMVSASQIVSGSYAETDRRLRVGGWVTISQQVADLLNVEPGARVRLPTPTGNVAFRVAATTSNLGWGPGAVVINSIDYRRAWRTADPSAIEVDVSSPTSVVGVKHEIERVLGPTSGLQVQTSAERAAHADGIAREGLAPLSRISSVLLIAALTAVAAAMGTGIWQRRALMAKMRIMGWHPPTLWRALLCETVLVLGVGCVTGAVAGLYGHFLGDRWLQLSTGYPAPFALSDWHTVWICVLVSSAALAATAVPSYLASRTSPHLGIRPS